MSETAETPAPIVSRPRAARQGRVESGRMALVDALDTMDALDEARLAEARRAVRVRTLAVRRGEWDASADAPAVGSGPGFVIVEGALLRRVTAGHRTAAELLGAGDVLRPEEAATDVGWRALQETRLAVVDRRALADAAAVPEMTVGLVAAAARRAGVVARQLAIAQWTSVDERLVATMQLLSERWGVVTRDGIVVPAFLSHSTLAPLLGARRPSVTTALQRLASAGRILRLADGRWLLASD